MTALVLPFDPPTQERVDELKERPVDRWGAPLFCRDCPERKFVQGFGSRNSTCARRKQGQKCRLVAENFEDETRE